MLEKRRPQENHHSYPKGNGKGQGFHVRGGGYIEGKSPIPYCGRVKEFSQKKEQKSSKTTLGEKKRGLSEHDYHVADARVERGYRLDQLSGEKGIRGG